MRNARKSWVMTEAERRRMARELRACRVRSFVCLMLWIMVAAVALTAALYACCPEVIVVIEAWMHGVEGGGL